MSDVFALSSVDRRMPPAELARYLYQEGDRHPVGSDARREAYMAAAQAQREADRLEANRVNRRRRAA